MRVLVTISVLAFAALLWACIGVAQHVRQASRTRRKRASSAGTDTFANQL
jgi:hypothetical protein